MWTHPVSGQPIPFAPDVPLFELSTNQNEAVLNLARIPDKFRTPWESLTRAERPKKNPFTGNTNARLLSILVVATAAPTASAPPSQFRRPPGS